MNRRYLKFASLGMIIGCSILAVFAYQLRQPISYVQDLNERQLPNLGGPFTLTDQFGKKRSDSDFRGKYMLVYFGYSFCPDVCPLGLQNIGAALDQLGRDLDQVVPIFITVDPKRDTVENMHIYAQNWHSSFIMLTGTDKELDPVKQAYKVYAAKVKPDGTMADYLIDHSALVYLINREGKFIDFFPHTTEPAKIVELIKKQLLKDVR